MAATVGTGASLTPPGGGTTSTFQITNINWSDHSRPALDTSHLKTTTGRSFTMGELYDAGVIEITVLAATGDIEDLTDTNNTAITVSDGAGATFTAAAFAIGWDMSLPLEEIQTATVRYKLSGAVG